MTNNKRFGNSEQLENEKDHVADPGNMVGDLISRAVAIDTIMCEPTDADGTPINTASDFYDDKGKRINNPQTYKSIYGERKDGDQNG